MDKKLRKYSLVLSAICFGIVLLTLLFLIARDIYLKNPAVQEIIKYDL